MGYDGRDFLKICATRGAKFALCGFCLTGCTNQLKDKTYAKKLVDISQNVGSYSIEGENMDEMIAYCGLNCLMCPIYLATSEENDEKKKQMRIDIVNQCKEQYGMEIKLEDVTDCDGCKAEAARLFSGCKDCRIRLCARQKNIENCAYCGQYICEKLEKFFTTDKDAKKRLDKVRSML